MLDNKVKLRFAEGILPGWDIEERNVCTKEVHFNEISCTKVKFVFEQIGGKEENVIKEKTKSWNETLKDITVFLITMLPQLQMLTVAVLRMMKKLRAILTTG